MLSYERTLPDILEVDRKSCDYHMIYNLIHKPCMTSELSLQKKLCRYFSMKAQRQEYARPSYIFTELNRISL